MEDLGDWSSHDDKKYIGKLDRIYVSMTEEWEVEYFIDKYLEDGGYKISNKNRNTIADTLEKYQGKAPFKRDDLKTYLDGHFKKS